MEIAWDKGGYLQGRALVFSGKNLNTLNVLLFGCSYLKEVNLSKMMNKRIGDVSYAFYGCRRLQKVDLIGFDHLTNMRRAFACIDLSSNLDIIGIDGYYVEDISYMFWKSRFESLDLRGFNFFSDCNVTYMIDFLYI